MIVRAIFRIFTEQVPRVKAAASKNMGSACLRVLGHLFHFCTQTFVGKILVRYGIALALLGYVIYKNRDGLGEVLNRPLVFQPLLIATGIYIVGLLITFLRWHMLVRAVGLPFSRYEAIRLGLVGFFFNTFLPGSIGGDVVKSYAIAKENKRRTLAVATVLVDRVLGLWALIWFVALAGGYFWLADSPILDNPSLKAIVVSCAVFVGASALIWAALGLMSDEQATRLAARVDNGVKWRHSIAELWRACWMYRQRPKAVALAMLMTLVAHGGWVLVFHYSVLAFPPQDVAKNAGSIAEHAVVVPVGMTVSAFIPLPGAIGVGEAAFGKLYEILGKPKINGVVGCMSQRVITWSLGLFGYLVYLRMKRREVPAVSEIEAMNEDQSAAEPQGSSTSLA